VTERRARQPLGVNLGDIAPKVEPVPELHELLLDNFGLDKAELHTGRLSMSGPCFRHFGFDDRRQSVNTFEGFLVEVGLYQLDAEMPLDLHDELEYVDGIDFQFSAEQRLVVAQIPGGQVGDPQAIQYNGLELLPNARHVVRLQHQSIPQSSPVETNTRSVRNGLWKLSFVCERAYLRIQCNEFNATA